MTGQLDIIYGILESYYSYPENNTIVWYSEGKEVMRISDPHYDSKGNIRGFGVWKGPFKDEMDSFSGEIEVQIRSRVNEILGQELPPR